MLQDWFRRLVGVQVSLNHNAATLPSPLSRFRPKTGSTLSVTNVRPSGWVAGLAPQNLEFLRRAQGGRQWQVGWENN